MTTPACGRLFPKQPSLNLPSMSLSTRGSMPWSYPHRRSRCVDRPRACKAQSRRNIPAEIERPFEIGHHGRKVVRRPSPGPCVVRGRAVGIRARDMVRRYLDHLLKVAARNTGQAAGIRPRARRVSVSACRRYWARAAWPSGGPSGASYSTGKPIPVGGQRPAFKRGPGGPGKNAWPSKLAARPHSLAELV